MGMFDTIRWDAVLPEGHSADDGIFQTKSLHPCLEHYRVTPEGRLLLVGTGWQDDDLAHAHDLKGVDVDFHGDLEMESVEDQRQYLVRFTHGTLEWVRPIPAGMPWDSVAIASMKFHVSFAAQQSAAAPTATPPAVGEAMLKVDGLWVHQGQAEPDADWREKTSIP